MAFVTRLVILEVCSLLPSHAWVLVVVVVCSIHVVDSRAKDWLFLVQLWNLLLSLALKDILVLTDEWLVV